MDKRFGSADWLIVSGGFLLLVASRLPWWTVEWSGVPATSTDAFDYTLTGVSHSSSSSPSASSPSSSRPTRCRCRRGWSTRTSSRSPSLGVAVLVGIRFFWSGFDETDGVSRGLGLYLAAAAVVVALLGAGQGIRTMRRHPTDVDADDADDDLDLEVRTHGRSSDDEDDLVRRFNSSLPAAPVDRPDRRHGTAAAGRDAPAVDTASVRADRDHGGPATVAPPSERSAAALTPPGYGRRGGRRRVRRRCAAEVELDVSRFRVGDWVLVGAGVAMLVLGLAVPWVSVEFGGVDLGGARNAFDYPLTGGAGLAARRRRRRRHVPARGRAAARRAVAVDPRHRPRHGRRRRPDAAARACSAPATTRGPSSVAAPACSSHWSLPAVALAGAVANLRAEGERLGDLARRAAASGRRRRRDADPVAEPSRERRSERSASRRDRPSARRPRSGCARPTRRLRPGRPSCPGPCPCRRRRWRRRGPSSCRPAPSRRRCRRSSAW